MVLYHRLQNVFGTNSHLCGFFFQFNFLEVADTQDCKSVMFVFLPKRTGKTWNHMITGICTAFFLGHLHIDIDGPTLLYVGHFSKTSYCAQSFG